MNKIEKLKALSAAITPIRERVYALGRTCEFLSVEKHIHDAYNALEDARIETACLIREEEQKEVVKPEPELTEWIPVQIKPVHVGWYEYCGPHMDLCMLYWNGSQWGYKAPFGWTQFAEDDGDEWRGLAAPAKGD